MKIVLFLMIIMSLSAQRIKFATLAPEGSPWYNTMNEFADEVKQSTNGKVTFKIYAGGVKGDERATIDLIRVGNLHAGGYIGPGLNGILPEVRILDLPMLFNNKEEVDYVLDELFPEFQKRFEKSDFHLLAWANAGFVNVFSTEKIESFDDLKNAKLLELKNDDISNITMKALGLNTFQIDLINVLQSLSTGMINTTYAPAYGGMALQWHRHQKYFIDINLAYSIGAIVISKKQWDKISPEHQKLMSLSADKHFKELRNTINEVNEKSKETIKNQGLEILKFKDTEKLREASLKAREMGVGKIYPKELLDKVESLLKKYRNK
jgi:TRAP-type transport system periplasmic protein